MGDEYGELSDWERAGHLPRPKRKLNEIAVFGGWEDDLALGGSFIDTGEILARHWIEKGPDDGLPVPILCNYRHGIELTLKWLIRYSARFLREQGRATTAHAADKVDKAITSTHSLMALLQRFEEHLERLELDPLPTEARDPVVWLHEQDPSGEAYRYAIVGKGKNQKAARPEPQDLNFYEQVDRVHVAAGLLGATAAWLSDIHDSVPLD